MEVDLQCTYERLYRSLLWRVRPRDLQRGVDRCLAKANQIVEAGTPPREALQRVKERTRERVLNHLLAALEATQCPVGAEKPFKGQPSRALGTLLRQGLARIAPDGGPDFHCDASLCGLARWLRAAGYDAPCWPDIADDALLEHTLSSNAILLTTDRRLMQRGVIVCGLVPALLVPVDVNKREQFAYVVSKLTLPMKQPRCMACGGELSSIPKAQVRDRVPPRTYQWRDEYFTCRRCGKLYWEGTHWQRIRRQLNRVRQFRSKQ